MTATRTTTTATFELEVDEVGRGTLLVNGEDISRRTTAVRVDARVGEITTVTVEQRPATARIEGVGIVQVVETQPADPAAVAAFLAMVDPDELERLVLERSDWGTSTMPLVLAVLRELAALHG